MLKKLLILLTLFICAIKAKSQHYDVLTYHLNNTAVDFPELRPQELEL